MSSSSFETTSSDSDHFQYAQKNYAIEVDPTLVSNYTISNYTTAQQGYQNTIDYSTLLMDSSSMESLGSSSSSEHLEEDIALNCDEKELLHMAMMAMSAYGVKKFVDRILKKEFLQDDVVVFSDCLKSSIVENSSQRKLFVKDVKSVLNRENYNDFPHEPEKYLSYHWTERFSKCMNDGVKVVELEKDFNDTVRTVSKIIILEKQFPDYMKSILPANVGGKAGGQKYIIHGILFKFAEDNELHPGKWLYGGNQRNDFIAAKGLNNEIQALGALFQFVRNQSLFKLPLMSTYCFLGVTILAVSLLPINSKSLVYGTADAGKNIYDGLGDIELLEKVEFVRKEFKFANHCVMNAKHEKKYLSFAADVEVHKVKGAYYILDLGRFMPANDPANPFTHMFRPNSLKKYDDPISPELNVDAFSGFGRVDNEKWNTISLNYIDTLYEKMLEDLSLSIVDINEDTDITEMLHLSGFNLRFMGRLRSYYLTQLHLPADLIASVLLKEMILRSIKTIFLISLNQMMENQVVPVENAYRDRIIKLYAKCRDPKFWKEEQLKTMIQTKYGTDALQTNEKEYFYSLLSTFDKSQQDKIFKDIPKYARFRGGIVNFDTEILGYSKSFLKQENKIRNVEELTNLDTADASLFWDQRDYLLQFSEPNILFAFFKKFCACIDELEMQHYTVKIISQTMPLYYEHFKEDLGEIFDILWNVAMENYLKTALLIILENFNTYVLNIPVIYEERPRFQFMFVDTITYNDMFTDSFVDNLFEIFKDSYDLYPFLHDLEFVSDEGFRGLSVENISPFVSHVKPGEDDNHNTLFKENKFYNLKFLTVENPLELSSLANYSQLERLEVYNYSGDNSALTLSNPQAIRILSLKKMKLEDGDIKTLIPQLTNVTDLDLSENELTDSTMKLVSALYQIISLNVSNLKITDKGIVELTKLSELQELDISRSSIVGECIYEMKKLNELNILHAKGVLFDNDMLISLKSCKKLKFLIIHYENGLKNILIGGKALAETGTKISDQNGICDAFYKPMTKKERKKYETMTSKQTQINKALEKKKTIKVSEFEGMPRIMMHGDCVVGKSYYLYILKGGTFSNEWIESTSVYDYTSRDNNRFRIQDTPGQDEYAFSWTDGILDYEGFILMYNITSRSTFENLSKFIGIYEQTFDCSFEGGESPKAPPVLLIGNKTDLSNEREVPFEEGKEFADRLGLLFMETSAKTKKNLEESFSLLETAISSRNHTKKSKKSKKSKKKK